MKKQGNLLLALVMSLLCWQPVGGQCMTDTITLGESTVMTLGDIVAKGLMTMCFETVDHEEPTCEYVSAPPGCMGRSIRNAVKVPGRLVIYQRIDNVDSVLYDSGEYVADTAGMTIRLRGNTSAYEAKKPYKIKLEKKRDLLMRGNEAVYKDKDWLLLQDDWLLTAAGFKAGELLGMTWTPGFRYVNVIINGDYRGIYQLCESVKRNPDCRLKVDKTSGFIFECDPYWWNEDAYVTSVTAPSYNFTFKYPDSDDLLPEQLDYMQGLVSEYERSLTHDNYPDFIDVESFAAWCLGHDIMGTKDAGGTNRYYIKNDTTDTSKIVMPLLWDFGMAERTAGNWSNSHIDHFTKLFNNSNRTFVDAFVSLWAKVHDTFVADMQDYLVNFKNSPEGKAVTACSNLNNIVWGRTMNVAVLVISRNSWFTQRAKWLDTAIGALNPVGDVDLSGDVTVSDLTALINMLLGATPMNERTADINGDGEVSPADISMLINMLLTAE